MNLTKRQWGMLSVFIGVSLAGGVGGSVFTMEAIPTWYASIEKPSWTPPNAVFGPVWTTLYVMIGIAGWLVSRQPERKLLTIWIAQLALNFIWTPLFFGAHHVGWALADISVMWILIGWFVLAAWKPARTAAILFLPYFAWVSYAVSLNYGVWVLN